MGEVAISDTDALGWLYDRSATLADRAAMAMNLGDAAAASTILVKANTVLQAVQILEKELSASRPADRVLAKVEVRPVKSAPAKVSAVKPRPALALVPEQPARDRRRWCEQCDASIMLSAAATCRSGYCKLRSEAQAALSPSPPETARTEVSEP